VIAFDPMEPTGTLFVVGTPIGNLEDMTDRARRVLAQVDVVAAEDTRRTGRLLRSMGIKARLVSFFEGNERRKIDEVLALLRAGQDVAMVSDAGMPGISDPGYRVVAACVEAGLSVDVAPGPSAAVAALVISGLPTDRFVFEGFLPRSGRARADRLAALASEPRTVVLFESARRVAATLADLLQGGDRRVSLARELTKLHQEVQRGRLSEILEDIRGRELKGEVVLVVEGSQPAEGERAKEAVRVARELVAEGVPKRDAARRARAITGAGVSAREIYERLIPGSKE
jgi:16S rRNA (cytidine1402-2'-O)-methyltransferase